MFILFFFLPVSAKFRKQIGYYTSQSDVSAT